MLKIFFLRYRLLAELRLTGPGRRKLRRYFQRWLRLQEVTVIESIAGFSDIEKYL